MGDWSESELSGADFHDQRLTKRLIKVVERLAQHPASSVPDAMGDCAATKAAYRFWDSEKVSAAAIRESHISSTIERVAEHEAVLAIQDSCWLDYATHRATTGLGALDRPVPQGLWVHST